jgi:hypothetical protein
MTDTLQTGERRRRPQHGGASPAEPSIAIVRDDLYAVLAMRETMGFVERVGNVFVALHGPDLARAVEVGQSLSWDQCVSMVRREYSRR